MDEAGRQTCPRGPVLGIDHVQLAAPADCEPAARAFFAGLLGLEEIEKPPSLRGRGGAWFRCGSQQLHVGVAGEMIPARKAHPALLVEADAIEALAGHLQGAGFEPQWDRLLAPRRRFYVDDPWGNRIELIAAEGSDA